MGYIVKMPKLGLEMERGTLLEWKVAEDDEITEGDVIAEIETEKSIGEVEAREGGIRRRMYVSEGESVPPGTPIGIVAAADADIADLEAEAEAEAELEAAAGEPVEAEASAAAGDETESDVTGTEAERASGSAGTEPDVKASPRGKKRAEELDVDLTAVEGTGPQGAITAGDVEAAAESVTEMAEAKAEEVKASPRAKQRAEDLGVDLTTVEGTGPQGAVTADDVEAAAETAVAAEKAADTVDGIERIAPDRHVHHRYRRVTAVTEPDVADALFDSMAAARNAFDADVTLTDVVLVALSATLEDRPTFNATFQEATHHLHDRQDIAIGVETGGELVAPVITGVERRSLAELVETRQELVGRALAGDLAAENHTGPTFTLVDAADLADPEAAVGSVVNPPGVASLEVDPIYQRAVPEGDAVHLQGYVTFALTYDERAVDAEDSRRFLDELCDNVERAPELLLKTYQT